MIPSCDPSVLEKNPQFQKLHQNLTANLLNVDATTRANQGSHERKSTAEELRISQSQNAKRKIIKQALRHVCVADSVNARDEALSDNIREVCAVIAMFLDALPGFHEFENPRSETAGQISLLDLDVQSFHDYIHLLVPLFSEIIASWLNSLRSIADATDSSPPSSLTTSKIPTTAANQSRPRIRSRISNARRIHMPRLSTQLDNRIKRLRQLQTVELPTSRRKIATTAAKLLAARGEAMERMIVLTERTKHGALSRATKAQADYLATVTECMSKKIEVTKLEALSIIYTPENAAALENYRVHLQETLAHLEEKQRIATQTLEDYEKVGADLSRNTDKSGKAMSGPMADIARRYRELAQEVEAIEREIVKLKV